MFEELREEMKLELIKDTELLHTKICNLRTNDKDGFRKDIMEIESLLVDIDDTVSDLEVSIYVGDK